MQEHNKINVGDYKRDKRVCVLISETLLELVVFNRIKRLANDGEYGWMNNGPFESVLASS